jgi:hypothetical protein
MNMRMMVIHVKVIMIIISSRMVLEETNICMKK